MQMEILADSLPLNYEITGILPRSFADIAKYRNEFYDKFAAKSLCSRDILNCLYRLEPDVIYQRGGQPFLAVASYYCRSHDCKVIWHIASESDVKPFHLEWNRSILFGYIDKKFLEYGVRNADYIIGQAKYQDELLQQAYDRKCDLIVPNFHPLPKREIKKENPVKIVWVSNFKKMKQPEIFIRLAGEFENREDVRFVMAGRPGQGKWQIELETRMDGLRNLEYLGEIQQDEVNRILCESHIFVNTSTFEGFPNTFIQAWMRKLPVVSLRVNPDNLLTEKEIGLHSESFAQMVTDVRRLINDRKLREEMGDNAQEYAFENHTVEKNVEKIIRLFGQ